MPNNFNSLEDFGCNHRKNMIMLPPFLIGLTLERLKQLPDWHFNSPRVGTEHGKLDASLADGTTCSKKTHKYGMRKVFPEKCCYMKMFNTNNSMAEDSSQWDLLI